MAFVSEIMGRIVSDIDGEKVGKVKDLLASSSTDKIVHPRINAVVVATRQGDLMISVGDVATLLAPALPLKKHLADVVPYQPTPNDLWLVRDVLDKQIIDINGVRVVRVNDLELTRVNDDIYISNVDVGGAGLIRRMGFKSLAKRTRSLGSIDKPAGIISWDDVELLSGDQPMRLKVPAEKLADLHPADLAEILSDLNRSEGRELLQKLDVETMADALEEVEPELQASLLEEMPNEQVADVLEEMAPDEAADLLAEMPEDRSKQLLQLMESDEAADVRHLLTFPEDSAGGIMNTEFVTVRPDWTAAQTLEHLRTSASEAETIYYIYVTDDANHLLGVFSLRGLVLSKPRTPVKDFMEDRVVTVNLLDTQNDCAQIVSKYNLLALPVVDDQHIIHGIISAGDALDKIIPTAWKKRLPRMYR